MDVTISLNIFVYLISFLMSWQIFPGYFLYQITKKNFHTCLFVTKILGTSKNKQTHACLPLWLLPSGCSPCRDLLLFGALMDASTGEWGPPRAACEPIGTGLWRVTGNSSGGDGAQLEIWKGRQQTEKPKKTQRPCREASYARKGRHASAGPEEKGLEWAVKEKASTVSGASEAS